MRGSRNFLLLFPAEITADVPETIADRKGRSEELIQKRNQLLICRYYYYAKMVGYQYHTSLQFIEKEMFLTERTIQDILQKNQDYLRHFQKNKPDYKFFREKYPHLLW